MRIFKRRQSHRELKKFIPVAGVLTGFLLTRLLQNLREMNLRGRTVVITGGSRGLGLVMARQLIKEGAQVAICGRNRESLKTAFEELNQTGGRVLVRQCNVADSLKVQTFIASVHQHFGPVDVLINNAGMIEVGPIDSMTSEDYEEAMNTHFWGPLNLIQAVLPEMQARGEGRVVNIASIGGKISVPHLVPYCASKFALVGLSEGLRAELAQQGILVTTICPGLMRTGSHHRALFKGRHQAEFAWFSHGASMPFLSMSAERAASRIIQALKRGEAEVTLSIAAQLTSRLNTLFPSAAACLLSLVNRALPAPGGIETAKVTGLESHSEFSPSFLTTLGDRAAARNNEFPAVNVNHP